MDLMEAKMTAMTLPPPTTVPPPAADVELNPTMIAAIRTAVVEERESKRRERRGLAAGKYPVKHKLVEREVDEGEGVDAPEYVMT